MNISFNQIDDSRVVLGQVRSDGHDTAVLVTAAEGEGFNAISLTGENKFLPIYKEGKGENELYEDYPINLQVHELKIISSREF